MAANMYPNIDIRRVEFFTDSQGDTWHSTEAKSTTSYFFVRLSKLGYKPLGQILYNVPRLCQTLCNVINGHEVGDVAQGTPLTTFDAL